MSKLTQEMDQALKYMNGNEKVKEIEKIWANYIPKVKAKLDTASGTLQSLEKSLKHQTKDIRGGNYNKRLKANKELRKSLELTPEWKSWSKWDELHKALIAKRREYLTNAIEHYEKKPAKKDNYWEKT